MLTMDQIKERLALLLVDITAAPVPPSHPVVKVGPGANLSSLLEQALPDTEFVLAPDFVHMGDLLIPKSCLIRTATDPPPGRVQPSLAAPPQIVGAVTMAGPYVMVRGVTIQGRTPDATLVTTGRGTVLDRCLVRGHENGQHRGIAANSADVLISSCWIDRIFYPSDSQAIAGWDGTQGLTVDDCYLEASGENVIFGGTDPKSAARIPTNIRISNCRLSKSPAWRGQPSIVVKNLLELKNVIGVNFRGNTCDYSWLSGQTGFAVVLTVRNQEGTAPYSTIRDVAIVDNTFTHMGAGISILGEDDTHPSERMGNVLIQKNLFADVDPVAWGGAGRQVQILNGPKGLSLIGNTFQGANLQTAFTFDGKDKLSTGLQVMSNVFQEGEYGIHGADAPGLGKAVLDMYAPGYLWADNTIVRGSSGRTITYPPGTRVIDA